MLARIILSIIIVGFCDVYLVVLSAKYLTVFGAIGLCLFTAFLGGYLFKREGQKILKEFQTELQEGRMPLDKIGDGVLILIGGAFLITPGFITDFFGFLLMVPFVRKLVKPLLVKIARNNIKFQMNGSFYQNGFSQSTQEKDAEIIDIK